MLLNEIAFPPVSFKALILAGPPASGKSSLYDMIAVPANHGYLNTDNMRHSETRRLGLEGDVNKHEQHIFNNIKNEVERFLFSHVINGNPIIFETTADAKNNFERRVTLLQSLGYDVALVYTHVDEETSQQLAKKRTEIEPRSLDPQFISSVYEDMPTRLAEIAKVFGSDNFLYIPRETINYTSSDVSKIQQFASSFFRRPLENNIGVKYRRQMLAKRANLLRTGEIPAKDIAHILSMWYLA